MCKSMVDIQSPTAEFRRGQKKKERRKKPQGKNIMACPITESGHNKYSLRKIIKISRSIFMKLIIVFTQKYKRSYAL